MMRWMMRLRREAGISCAHVQDLVQAHLDGELPDGPERDRLIAHLDLCRRCGVEAEILEQIKASLATRPSPESVARLVQFAGTIPDRHDADEGPEER